MAEKIKLSVIADAGAPTGFSTVTHNICGFLQDTDQYEINILGINFSGRPNEWSKRFNIYPASLGGDPLGIGYAGQFIEETQPDAIWLFQDFWNIPYYIGQIGLREGMVGYYPVDAPNMRGQYIVSLSSCVELGTYTKFGVEESARAASEAWEVLQEQAKNSNVNVLTTLTINLESAIIGKNRVKGKVVVPAKRVKDLQDISNFYQIPHGINRAYFFPVDKAQAREGFHFGKDWFIIGNVNRNQSRKRLDLTIKAFSLFAKDKPNVRLVLHCVANDVQGWDLEQLARYYGVADKVLLTHRLFGSGQQANLRELNQLYNTFDVQVNSGGGEGWGLTSFEGAACGIPQVVPNWSATQEIWKDSGLLIDVIEVRHEPHTINTAQAIISVTHLVEHLNNLYESKDLLVTTGNKCLEVTQRPDYSWEYIGEQFDEVFKRAAGKKPPTTPIALNAKGLKEIKQAKFKQYNAK